MTFPIMLLGDVCQTFTGGTPSRTKPQYFGGGIPWVKITDMLQGTVLATDESLSDDGIANSSAKVLPVGTVLISIFATIGRTAVLGIEAATNQAIAGVVPKDTQQLQSDYLRYFLDSKHSELNRVARGVAQPNINQGILKGLEIPIPPLPEQLRIVDLLSRAEGIVRLRREAEKKAAELIPALFLDMFGDPATNPKGWRTAQLKSLGKVITGGTPPTANEGMFGGDIPFITPGDLELDTLLTKRFLTAEGSQHARTIRSGATMVCCIGATIGKTDRTWAMSAFNQQINGIDWNTQVVDDDYGLVCMRFFSREVAARGSSTALPILKKSLFEMIEIPVPVIEAQRGFAQQMVSIRSIQVQQSAATAKAQETFDALLEQAFSN